MLEALMDGFAISSTALSKGRTVYCSKNRLWWHPGAQFHAACADGSPIRMTRAIATALDIGDLCRVSKADPPHPAPVTGTQTLPCHAAPPPAASAPPVASPAPAPVVAPLHGAPDPQTACNAVTTAQAQPVAAPANVDGLSRPSSAPAPVVAPLHGASSAAPQTVTLIKINRGKETARLELPPDAIRETDTSFIVATAAGATDYLQKARGWQRATPTAP